MQVRGPLCSAPIPAVWAQGRCVSTHSFTRPSICRRAPKLRVEAQASNGASTVKLIMQGRRLPLTNSIRSYVEEKVLHALAYYAHQVRQVDVTLSARGGDTGTKGPRQQKVDVTVFTLRHGVVRVEDAEDSLYASVDTVCDKLARKMKRVKERAMAQGSWPGRARPRGRPRAQVGKMEEGGQEAIGGEQEEEEEVRYQVQTLDQDQDLTQQQQQLHAAQAAGGGHPSPVLRRKEVALTPMGAEEAVEALEAVGHDFYVFMDATTGGVQVVYRRKSEGYGLLIPRM